MAPRSSISTRNPHRIHTSIGRVELRLPRYPQEGEQVWARLMAADPEAPPLPWRKLEIVRIVWNDSDPPTRSYIVREIEM